MSLYSQQDADRHITGIWETFALQEQQLLNLDDPIELVTCI